VTEFTRLRVPPELRKALDGWLHNLSWEQLICRDVGHIWTAAFTPGETYTPNRYGSYELNAPCLRGCGCKRTRFLSPGTGYIARANTMNYTGSPGYLVPEALASTTYTRDVNGHVRMEIQRRNEQGDYAPPELLSPVLLRAEAAPR
jgi:hypothetical protein